MKPIRSFDELTEHLKSLKIRKRIAVVCANDPNTEYAIARALEEGIAEFLMIGDSAILNKYPTLRNYPDHVKFIHIENPDEAAREAVRIVREGGADVLMKGIINTDNLLRAILDKEKGLLPKGKVLTHLSVVQIPTYDKLLFFSDAAVVPRPSLQQRIEMIWYAIRTCHSFGIKEPRVALIHFSEKVSAKFQNSLDYVNIVELAEAGEFGNVIIDGPLDVRTACEKASGDIKGIASPINGEADVLIFPNIEAGNTFYKSVSLFAKAEMAGLLQGPVCPVVLPSRSDSGLSKYYSIAMACLTSK
ncbi:phosphate butyryltransferase [Bacteroides sp. 214]|uniref:phosphate acyltransferase n=1 Tax=Bacteroides sp. 214 TaxID=2302935 RepID=UPI0013D549B3|nr:phosphate acyltransferase [Bacteroides sp. 214]NDW13071.1 phosphate butyryltransferase [Bacteroides sp. 214]